MEHGLLLYQIVKLEMPTLGAIAVETYYLPKLFQITQKINRAAKICNQYWTRTAAEIERRLIPGLGIKAFNYDKEDKAVIWLNSKK